MRYLYVYNSAQTEVTSYLTSTRRIPDENAEPSSRSTRSSAIRDDLLAGGEAPPVLSDGAYGWLLTAYAPIRDASGKTVAYAGADISTEGYINGIISFLLRLVSLEIAICILINIIMIWYAERQLLHQINCLVDQAVAFNSCDPETWLSSDAWLGRERVCTGDEIETLYHTICRVEENVSRNVTAMRNTERRLIAAADIERRNRELSRAVEKADAKRRKTEFYSRMSHDMRTP